MHGSKKINKFKGKQELDVSYAMTNNMWHNQLTQLPKH